MSGKRQATSELNHDNWDREEEPEERGTFPTASQEEIKQRVIKKARRKIADPCGAGDAADGPRQERSVFSGFSGFANTSTSSAPGAVAFSFLSKIPSVASSASSSNSLMTSSITQSVSSQKVSSIGDSEAKKPTTTATTSKKYEFNKSNSYYAKLKGLNQAVADWIKIHVDKNPLCILTPVFKDYAKYLSEIEDEEKASEKATVKTVASSSDGAKSTQSFSNFKFSTSPAAASLATSTSSKTSPSESGLAKSTTEASTTFGNKLDSSNTNGFSFNLKTDNKLPQSTGFTFGKASSTTTTDDKPSSTVMHAFSFSNSKPFSFGNVAPPPAAEAPTTAGDEDEEDQPPKVEFKQVVEEDSVYSKKCKLFVKSGGKFSDRGVGTLYLKPVKDTDKTQLLLRADTNIGNILVNLILNESIPSQRMGKNNVMLVCIPTPETEKATPILLRVKTSEEADELLANIEKHKK